MEMAVVRYRSSPWFVDVTILPLLLQQKMWQSHDEAESEGSEYVCSGVQDTYGKVKDALLKYAADLVV